ncbi:MAG: SAM-dependent methyltransferase [Polyangia bacterium]
MFAWKYRVHDPWSLRSSAYEQTRYQRMLDLLPDRASYPRVLELGCAEGAFTHKLADAMAGPRSSASTSATKPSRAPSKICHQSQVTLRDER